ncbi:MAG: DUF262 domain-containing protein [Chloracidobacterium sp.]|nr:DUF262 domain-containing protein [Chloracidobacterium sp.]
MERTQSVQQLIQDIVDKKVVLPEFQRDFVWEITKTYDLFDSIVKDIFVGAILGCTDLDIAFVVPATEMEGILPELNTTDQYRERENYWHIFMREEDSGQYGIVLSKTGGFFNLNRFAMSLSD